MRDGTWHAMVEQVSCCPNQLKLCGHVSISCSVCVESSTVCTPDVGFVTVCILGRWSHNASLQARSILVAIEGPTTCPLPYYEPLIHHWVQCPVLTMEGDSAEIPRFHLLFLLPCCNPLCSWHFVGVGAVPVDMVRALYGGCFSFWQSLATVR